MMPEIKGLSRPYYDEYSRFMGADKPQGDLDVAARRAEKQREAQERSDKETIKRMSDEDIMNMVMEHGEHGFSGAYADLEKDVAPLASTMVREQYARRAAVDATMDPHEKALKAIGPFWQA